MLFEQRPELVPGDQHAALVAVLAKAVGDHLDRHTNLNRLAAQVGQLGGRSGPSFNQMCKMYTTNIHKRCSREYKQEESRTPGFLLLGTFLAFLWQQVCDDQLRSRGCGCVVPAEELHIV